MKAHKIIDSIKLADVRVIVQGLLKGGADLDTAKAVAARKLDEAVNFRAIVRGPAGVALEAVDEAVFRGLIELACIGVDGRQK